MSEPYITFSGEFAPEPVRAIELGPCVALVDKGGGNVRAEVAPELPEALKELTLMAHPSDGEEQAALERARALVKRVEGGT